MIFRCVLVIACLASFHVGAQKIPLIRSGEVLDTGNELYDSAKYEEAIQEYLKIPKRDTNYVAMLYKLAIAYSTSKNYDSARSTYKRVLANSIDFRARVLRSQAISMINSGSFDQGIALFEEAIRQYPIDQALQLSMGAKYYDEKKYEKAKDIYFQILKVNPFHTGCHLNLALLSMRQGRKAHAMLSMGIYLAIQSKDNSRLVFLNNFLDNQLEDEGEIPSFGVNASDKLDQIIRAKIALDKNFKSQIPITAAVVKQYELLFDQLALLNGNTNDEWVSFYLPIYKAIKDQQQVQPFIYHLLTSADNEIASKWRNKNEKLLSAFYENVNQVLKSKTQKLAVPKYNINTPVTVWRDDSNLIDALGDKVNDLRVGPWAYFHSNSELQSAGLYNQKGVKIGLWKFYHYNGKLKSIENYETGEVTVYNLEGAMTERLFLKDDEIHGEATLYYPCGAISEKLSYDKGKRHGLTQTFYRSGKPYQKYSHKEGKLHGSVFSYYENGTLYNQMTYEEGKLTGNYMEYSSQGKKYSKGNYTNDNPTGQWKYYYSNGRLNRTGSYSSTGTAIGEWLYYDRMGQLTERRFFDEEGRFSGENIVYHNAVKHYVTTYKKGIIIKSTSFAPDGKVINSFGSNDGTFAVKYYYPTGQVMSEGAYKKGLNSGIWKYYNRFGKLTQTDPYEDDKVQGVVKSYFPTGETRSEKEYKDGQLHGYSVEYFRNGNKAEEGWYQYGTKEQQWLSYYPDQTLQSDYYYLNGELTGDIIDYALNGKKVVVSDYDQYGIKNVSRFTKDGLIKSSKKTEGAATTIEDLYATGKTKVRYTISCGKYMNDFIRYYPDGSHYTKNFFTDGKRNGVYEYWDVNGTKTINGYYQDDAPDGHWLYYHYNGKLSRDGYYRDGNLDSVWTYYHENGKIESVGQFLNDERQGVTRYYTPEGIPLLEKKFDEGAIMAYRSIVENENAAWKPFTGNERIEIKNKNGVVVWIEEWKDGVRQGMLRQYFENGTLFAEYTYDKGDLHGPSNVYYPNGKIWVKQIYSWDELEGKMEIFAEDGSMIEQSEFRMGIKDGKSILFDKGVKKKEFTFWSGMTEE